MKRTTFINKHVDSSNVARSTHQERRQINERNREYRGSKFIGPNEAKVQARQVKKSDSTSSITSLNLDEAGTFVSVAPAANTRESASALEPQASSALLRVGPGHTADPFDTSSVPINSSVIRLLRYYKEVHYTYLWSKIYTALDGKVDKKAIVRSSPEQVILQCMENQSRMNSLLAHIACHLSNEEGTNLAANSLTLLQRGTASLRKEFRSRGSKVNCDILVDALHLYLAAVALNQQDATRAHLAGVKAILKSMIEQGVRISTSRICMLALVDAELPYQLLSRYSEEKFQFVEHSTIRLIQQQAISFEDIQALPLESRP